MSSFTDQMGRTVALSQFPPRRIVSLVPSQTELLYDLGLENEVAGITKFCVHPPAWFHTKPRVGGTKTLNFNKIDDLQPDLIIGNKEENVREQIEALAGRYPVWMSDVRTLDDAGAMIRQIGALTRKPAEANELAAGILDRFALLSGTGRRLSAAYLIWRKPYMAAGGDTFIQDMLHRAGFANVFGHLSRYPEIDAEALRAAQPDVVLLSSEPYPFADKHLVEFRELCPAARLLIADGELFSWYGSRLRFAPAYFLELRKKLGLALF